MFSQKLIAHGTNRINTEQLPFRSHCGIVDSRPTEREGVARALRQQRWLQRYDSGILPQPLQQFGESHIHHLSHCLSPSSLQRAGCNPLPFLNETPQSFQYRSSTSAGCGSCCSNIKSIACVTIGICSAFELVNSLVGVFQQVQSRSFTEVDSDRSADRRSRELIEVCCRIP